jgi:hypothetical protein
MTVMTISRRLWGDRHPDFRSGTLTDRPMMLRWFERMGPCPCFLPVRVVDGFVFPTGRLVFTSGFLALFADRSDAEAAALVLVDRHRQGDYGTMPHEDQMANEHALTTGGRIMSAYPLDVRGRVSTAWVITEADRSSTTVLLPHEY